MAKKIIVGISGSSGVVLGVRLLEVLHQSEGIETHLIMTDQARQLIAHETVYTAGDVEKLATHVYDNQNMFAAIASGSFRTKGMVVIPCSMKTLAGIAIGYASNLLLRAADVCLKERRKLILVTRETPLNLIHIENMRLVTMSGGIILPPVMAFYNKPTMIEQMIDHAVGKVLDVLGVKNDIYQRWK
jgi:4-hydroxy-3-polyprenylbenzoate decarboxylase